MSVLWNDLLLKLPDPHLLQSWQWGEFKSQYGWRNYHLAWQQSRQDSLEMRQLFGREHPTSMLEDKKSIEAAAMMLVRSVTNRFIPKSFAVAYVPKGPLLDWSDSPLRKRVLTDLIIFAREKGAIFLKIDPDVVLGMGILEESRSEGLSVGNVLTQGLQQTGWVPAQDQIQYRNTVVLDLTPSEEAIMANMKQKTRYNIRLAGRKGVAVRAGTLDDLNDLYKMYAETSLRDGFVIREGGYYRGVWQKFMTSNMLKPLVAEVEGEPVAGLFLFHFGDRAYYMHGMSRSLHRNLMPNYLLQWEAIRYARELGCTSYDLWGAPDVFEESDPMWGVFRFKQGLGGEVARHIGAWDFPVRPLMYRMYTRVLPGILNLLRHRGKEQMRQMLED